MPPSLHLQQLLNCRSGEYSSEESNDMILDYPDIESIDEKLAFKHDKKLVATNGKTSSGKCKNNKYYSISLYTYNIL